MSETIEIVGHSGSETRSNDADERGRHIRRETQTTRATAHPIDPTKAPAEPIAVLSDQAAVSAAATPIGPTNPSATTVEEASAEPHPDPGKASTHASNVEVGLLVELWRQRQDLRRAFGRLDLQCQAICRRAVGGDKVEAGKLWAKIKADKADHPALVMILSPYTEAMERLDESASGLERQVKALVRAMPIWTEWGVSVRGMAELSLGGLIGEASRPVGDYRSVSAVWKRFGLAVIDGGRQRLVAGAEMALIHGYSPQRRAYAYTLSQNLMRAQREADPYRLIYDRRKAYEMERGFPKAHAHNRALRVMVKELLKDAWVADRHFAGGLRAIHIA